MTSSELSPRFVVFVVVSLLTHLLELAASGLLCHVIMKQDDLRSPWFSVAAGLLIIPMVAVQLASAVFLLRRRGETATGCETTTTAVLHILQLGFISRHFAVLQEAPLASKRAEVSEMLLLRLAFSFTSGCTLCLLQVYLILRGSHDASWAWAVGLSGAVTLFCVTWALATYRRVLPEAGLDLGLVTWPGTPLKMLWRAGEVLTRLLALGLFASLYTHWIFLVLGLHWAAMLACVCVPAMTSLDWRSIGCFRRVAICLMTSFAYIFAFLNTSADNAVFRYTFFYVMLFLENTTLVAVWLVQSSSSELSRNSLFVIVAAIAFITSIIAMIIYHKFFHIPVDVKTSETIAPGTNTFGPYGNTSCVSCKPTSASTSATAHPPIPPRPNAAGSWLNQYQSAVYCGQYYKHTVQDSLLDSVSDLNSTITVSSTHARLQNKLATIDDEVKAQDSGGGGGSSSSRQRSMALNQQQPRSSSDAKEETAKSKSPKSKWRKRTAAKKREKAAKTDSDMMSSTTDADHSEDSASQKRPVWLPSGDSSFANQLLTYSLENFDTADTADDERSSVATGNQGFVKTNSSSPRDIMAPAHSRHAQKVSKTSGAAFQSTGEHHWYSDGYSTDRTLDWPSQLQHKLWGQQESDPECRASCTECLHAEPDLSSIMRSASPGLPDGAPNQSRPLCYHERHLHYVPGQKSSYRSRRQLPGSSGAGGDKASQLLKSVADLERIQEQQRTRTHKEPRENVHGKSPRLPSPASDPSYGPKSKKKHSPRRKQQRSDKSTSQTSHQHYHHQHHHHKQQPPQLAQIVTLNTSQLPETSTTVRDDRLEFKENERLATGLLQGQGHVDTESRVTDISSAAKVGDPRFTVRVMTNNTSTENKTPTDEEKPITEDRKNQRPQRTDAKSGVSENSRSPLDVHTPTSTGTSVAPEPRPPSDPALNSGVASTTTAEVVYENIWQAEQVRGSTKPRRPTKTRTVNAQDTGGGPLSEHIKQRVLGAVTKDAWYVCSESEDSALPPEVLSSSVDGFTASENDSDASVEIVI
ncbi:XK-related protein [Elysia marginata]|uniref:XK-related protein n=1 Tax=Elysia marginata TaxID=1093978 RepID=A0AAV4GAH8_9GAST|nr:XK-related protein [Elysia marginata]